MCISLGPDVCGRTCPPILVLGHRHHDQLLQIRPSTVRPRLCPRQVGTHRPHRVLPLPRSCFGRRPRPSARQTLDAAVYHRLLQKTASNAVRRTEYRDAPPTTGFLADVPRSARVGGRLGSRPRPQRRVRLRPLRTRADDQWPTVPRTSTATPITSAAVKNTFAAAMRPRHVRPLLTQVRPSAALGASTATTCRSAAATSTSNTATMPRRVDPPPA